MPARTTWIAAPDLAVRLGRIAEALAFHHVDTARVHCVRARGSRANAWARIWGLPPIFQRALGLPAVYVIEFLCPAFDRLPPDEQDRVIIHELLHIPTTFSGGIRPERSVSLRIDRRTVERYYRRYLAANDPTLVGIVTKVVGGFFFAFHEGRIYRCVARGRLRRRNPGEDVGTSRIVPGDRVRFAPLSEEEGVIEQTLPRVRELARPLSGDRNRLQVIAANVDQSCIVFAARSPDPAPEAIDRFLALSEVSALRPLLCFNKCDLGDPGALAVVYERAGYVVLRTSVRTGEGLDALRNALAGHLTVIAGPSGVGKSSLLNALAADIRRAVGPTGRRGRGRQTTTTAELLPIGPQAFVVDTPGVQILEFTHLEADSIREAFPEIREAATLCAFGDCRHHKEPDCAVRRAVREGDIADSRYDSYLRLLDEAEEGTRRYR